LGNYSYVTMHIMYPRWVATPLHKPCRLMRPHQHSACCLAQSVRQLPHPALRVVPATMQAKVVGAKAALRELHSTNTWQTWPQHITGQQPGWHPTACNCRQVCNSRQASCDLHSGPCTFIAAAGWLWPSWFSLALLPPQRRASWGLQNHGPPCCCLPSRVAAAWPEPLLPSWPRSQHPQRPAWRCRRLCCHSPGCSYKQASNVLGAKRTLCQQLSNNSWQKHSTCNWEACKLACTGHASMAAAAGTGQGGCWQLHALGMQPGVGQAHCAFYGFKVCNHR
jgi:hypothetical protein